MAKSKQTQLGIRLIADHSADCKFRQWHIAGPSMRTWQTRGRLIQRTIAGLKPVGFGYRWLTFTCGIHPDCPAEAIMRVDVIEDQCETLLSQLKASK